jgi:hypothetical protein
MKKKQENLSKQTKLSRERLKLAQRLAKIPLLKVKEVEQLLINYEVLLYENRKVR